MKTRTFVSILILVFILPPSLCLAQEYQPLSQYEPKTSLYNPETIARYSSYSLNYYALDNDERDKGKIVLITILIVVVVLGVFVVGAATSSPY